MTWYAIEDATGHLISVGSVLGENLDPSWTVYTFANQPDTGMIWDSATHTFIPRPPDPPGNVATIFTINGGAPITWTNMPAALTPLPQTETKLPLFDARYGRLTARVQVAGFSGALLISQFSLDGVNYVNGPEVPIGTTGLKVSNLVLVPEQYKTDVFFRMAGQGGNATADPQFGMVTLQIA